MFGTLSHAITRESGAYTIAMGAKSGEGWLKRNAEAAGNQHGHQRNTAQSQWRTVERTLDQSRPSGLGITSNNLLLHQDYSTINIGARNTSNSLSPLRHEGTSLACT